MIDPVSTLSKSGNELTAHGVAERLIDWSKADGITLVCTSLLDEMSSQPEGGSPLQISTLADTWIHLNYLVQAGERNRGMSIIKSRGTAHSNQVRELILSDAGVTLADIYTAGGEVLMGTLRWEKESAERVANEVAEVAGKLKRVRLDAEEAELEVRAEVAADGARGQAGREDAAGAHHREPQEGALARPQPHARAARRRRCDRADGPNGDEGADRLPLPPLRRRRCARTRSRRSPTCARICEQFLAGAHQIEIVDVLSSRKRALADGIFMTPTLVKLAPLPARKIVGTLSDRDGVLQRARPAGDERHERRPPIRTRTPATRSPR